MKKIIITFVFMFITMISYAINTGGSEWHKFNSSFTSRYKSDICMMVHIDEEDKDTTIAIYIAIFCSEDLSNQIDNKNPIIIEYNDGTKEKNFIIKISSSIETYSSVIYHSNFICFMIDKNNFINKSIKAIHILTNSEDVFSHSPSKSWYQNEQEVKKLIIKETFDDYNNKLSKRKMFE